MGAWHLTLSSVGRNPLFPQAHALFGAIRKLGRVAGTSMTLFSIVDEHLHVGMLGERREAGRVARRIVLALRPLASAELETARIRAVGNRSHMQWLVPYLLDQPRHHGLPEHPALYLGSCFPDLVGARVVKGLRLCIRQALPRFRLSDAFRAVGLRPVDLVLPTTDRIRTAGAARLVASAAAALCVEVGLQDRSIPTVQARTAVCRIARAVGIPTSETAFALNLTPRAARRLAHKPLPEPIIRCVALRFALEDVVDDQLGRRRA